MTSVMYVSSFQCYNAPFSGILSQRDQKVALPFNFNDRLLINDLFFTGLSLLACAINSLPVNPVKRSTTPRWENPCFQHPQTGASSLPPADIPLKEALQHLYQKANIQKQAANVLKENYVRMLF
jgi:hypothetical protein